MLSKQGIGLVFEPTMLPKRGTPELASVILALLLLSAMLAPVLTEGGNGELNGGGSVIRQSIYLGLFGFTLANFKDRVSFSALRCVPVGIVSVLVWAALSMAWSINPGVGIRRLILTSIIIYNVFLLVSQCGSTLTINTVRRVLGSITVANYLAILFVPEWAIHQFATEEDPSIVGAWKGVLGQKNFAGPVCAMTIIFFALANSGGRRATKWSIAFAATYFLYRTNSKTSLALLGTSLAITCVYWFYNLYYQLLVKIVLLILASIAGLLLYNYWDVVTGPFARDDFLTGRGQIWVLLLKYSRENLLLGAGFGSFWNVGDVSPVVKYTGGWISKISSGHNGFLDLLTQIGLPGMLLAFWATFLTPFSKFLSSPLDKSVGGLIAAVIWFCVWHNLSESTLFNRDEAVETFLMLGIALLSCEVAKAVERPITQRFH